jgi:hypothetical protein
VKTTSKVTAAVNQNEVALLAHLAWQNAGCPVGREADFWQEVETQLKATRHLLAKDVKHTRFETPGRRKMVACS